MTLRRFAYVPHDGSPGVEFPDIFWDDQTKALMFGDGITPREFYFNGNVFLNGAFMRRRAQMDNCGSRNLNGVAENNPMLMPFASGSADNPLFEIVASGVIKINANGIYLLSYSLPFESDTGIILQGTSVGACWQWAANPGGPWNDLVQTKTFDTVHGVADDHGALTLPAVEQALTSGIYLRVVAFQVGTGIDVYINSNDNVGGPFNWSWARVEAFRVAFMPPPPPP